jgi:hypothetical protein
MVPLLGVGGSGVGVTGLGVLLAAIASDVIPGGVEVGPEGVGVT